MIDWPEQDIALDLTRAFARLAASAMASATGMRVQVRDAEGAVEIVTDDPKAIAREYGDATTTPESWSVKGLLEAERKFDEHGSRGV